MRSALVGVCLTLAACVATTPASDSDLGISRARPARPEASARTIGRSVGGREIRAHTFGKGPETVLILASIHGTEPAGTPLVEALMGHLARSPEILTGRRVVVVPRANPDGLAEGSRYNRRGVDLNRNFPAINRSGRARSGITGLSEPETRALEGLIREVRPARIVSIHQPLSCVDYDGPARGLAERMSAACGLPVKKLGARAGSLGAYAGEDLGIPTITLELPREAGALWRTYGRALLVAIEGR